MIESHSPRDLGAYYTPPLLANWVARELCSHLNWSKPVCVLDPACGDGLLLDAVRKAAPTKVSLSGRDIDDKALAAARGKLGSQAVLESGDTLLPTDHKPLLESTADGVISNPPWGATLSGKRSRYSNEGYRVARGQFDSFDLFIERMMKTCKRDCVCCFIVPEAILLPEHETIRTLLLDNTQLLLLARLGEGLFKGVYRDTLALIFRNTPPSHNTVVSCFPVGARVKKDVHNGNLSLDEAKRWFGHIVPQRRFRSNWGKEFDLAYRVGETALQKAESLKKMCWKKWVKVGRGIEIGKKGSVIECPVCESYGPVPMSHNTATCNRCGSEISTEDARSRNIIRVQEPGADEKDDWLPIIVGADVQRYACQPARYIQQGLVGINYKNQAEFDGRKLLVRKTGVGLRAAIDESGALTTQTVFHVVLQDHDTPWLLDYLQGILNSRVLLALHLRRSGDTQWRSHPYVTPKVFTALPIPDPTPNTRTIALSTAIAEASRDLRRSYDIKKDLSLESLIAALFQFDCQDCEWVGRVLDETGELAYFQALRFPSEYILATAAI